MAECYTFCDTQYCEVVMHVSTRWLSLELAIQRALTLHLSHKFNHQMSPKHDFSV